MLSGLKAAQPDFSQLMELDTIKDGFERIAKRQKLSSTKTQEVINQIEKEVDQAIVKMHTISSDASESPDHTFILQELRTRLNDMAPVNQLQGCQKELIVALTKYVKLLEKCFNQDISKAYKSMDFGIHIVNEIIASHFYRDGLFDLGDCFLHESCETDDSSLKVQFQEMHRVLHAMKARNLEPALSWVAKNSEQILQNGSGLELKLHQLQFMEILKQGGRDEALKYARVHLSPFASVHKAKIQKLMACLLWAGRLDQSPYTELMANPHWEKLADEVTRQFCSLLGQSYKSPLGVVIAAGIQGLPTLLKLTTVMTAKNQEWQSMKQLPVPVDLGREFQFHSVFVCPVLREQGGNENPPMLMPCGHVLSKQSILKLSKSSTRPFKCPYCPLDSVVSQCRQLHF
ncbi:protein RMD5 homolog isoform X2 [Typha angustifolia]|uniref:protein RMD5 homolog isoform X2 n=1 Tax=Typha angustifolia TaxID=59011 RepID=UPI003C3028D3